MTGMNYRQKMVVVAMDLLLLVELGYSVYRGQQPGADLTLVFLKYFVPSVIVTVALARHLIRRFDTSPLASIDAAAGHQATSLPYI
jgi:hypothetical protein